MSVPGWEYIKPSKNIHTSQISHNTISSTFFSDGTISECFSNRKWEIVENSLEFMKFVLQFEDLMSVLQLAYYYILPFISNNQPLFDGKN